MKAGYTFLIFLTIFLLSGFLIWKGFEQSSFQLPPKIENKTIVVSPSPELTNVLGVNESTDSAQVDQKLVPVVKVVDGDTIDVMIDGQKKSVRMIGINTPETVDPRRPVQCFGVEASNETKRLLTGKKVLLTKDVSETDKYDRILRLVYLPLDDGQMLFVNDYLVRQGFANNYTYPPDIKFDEQFKLAEQEARENKRGLWGKCQK